MSKYFSCFTSGAATMVAAYSIGDGHYLLATLSAIAGVTYAALGAIQAKIEAGQS